MSDENEEVCGESYEHDLSLIGEADESRTYECRRCGAEIVEDLQCGCGEMEYCNECHPPKKVAQ